MRRGNIFSHVCVQWRYRDVLRGEHEALSARRQREVTRVLAGNTEGLEERVPTSPDREDDFSAF